MKMFAPTTKDSTNIFLFLALSINANANKTTYEITFSLAFCKSVPLALVEDRRSLLAILYA